MTDTFPIIIPTDPIATADPRSPDERVAVLKGPHYELLLKNGEIVILYPGCNFEGVDFSGSDLTGVLLIGSTFNNCNFTSCLLKWTDFSECTMENCIFDEARMRASNFVNTSLVGSSFKKVDGIGNHFEGADISFCTFSGKLQRSYFSNSTAISTVFENSRLHKTTFQHANFGAVIFTDSNLTEVNFNNTHITCTLINNCLMGETSFEKSVLTKVDFVRTHGSIPALKFERAILEQVTFRHCDLLQSDFDFTNMFEVIFESCMVRHSRFICAELTNVAFQSSSLNDSNFTKAIWLNVQCVLSRFRSIDGEGTKMKDVIFNRSILHGAEMNSTELGNTQFIDCFFDKQTVWPDDYIFPISTPMPDNAACLTAVSDPSVVEPSPTPPHKSGEPLDECATDAHDGDKNS